MRVNRTKGIRRLKKRARNVITSDMKEMVVSEKDAQDNLVEV